MYRYLMTAMLVGCTIHKGDGDPGHETRAVSEFSSIANDTIVWVEATVGGDDYAVEVFCDENLLDDIETERQGDTLVVSTPDRVVVKPKADCGVTVQMPRLDEAVSSGTGLLQAKGDLTGFSLAENSGTGRLEIAGIDSASVELVNSGTGSINASGTADTVTVDNSGTGEVDARDLVAQKVIVLNSGTGHVAVTANQYADIEASGTGGVDVYGNPGHRDSKSSGSGAVVFH